MSGQDFPHSGFSPLKPAFFPLSDYFLISIQRRFFEGGFPHSGGFLPCERKS
jgi:hypothetical protein